MRQSSRNAMVVDNLPLVGYLVSDLCRRVTHLSREDLAAAGALALVQAADSFDPELGVPFGAYARRRVLGALGDEMRANDWASRGSRRRIRETLVVRETLTASLGRTVTTEEIATAMGLERHSVEAALADSSRSVTTLEDAEVVAAPDLTPEETALDQERAQFLRTAVAALPEKMRYIVEQIYFAERTVKDLATELGTTHSAVSQQRAEAVRLLRDGMTAHYRHEAGPAEPFVPSSRVSAFRRNDYLATVGTRAAGGFTRLAPVSAAL